MMKRQFIKIMVLVTGLFAMWSCFEDKSEYDVKSPDIVIDGEKKLPEVIRVGYRQPLQIDPMVVVGSRVNSDDFSYTWEVIDLKSKTHVISQERVLDVVLDMSVAATNYWLVLKVMDKKTMVAIQQLWPLYVVSFGSGVIVADTRDGNSSNISLIRSSKLSENYIGENEVLRDLMAEDFASTIKSVNYHVLGSMSFTYANLLGVVLNNKDVCYVNTNDYSNQVYYSVVVNIAGENQTIDRPLPMTINNIYPNREADFMPQMFRGTITGIGMVANDKFFRMTNTDNRSVAFLGHVAIIDGTTTDANHVDNGVLSTATIQYESPEWVWFDNIRGRFVDGGNMFASAGMIAASPLLMDRRAVCAGKSVANSHHAFLLKNSTTGDHEMYLISYDSENWAVILSPPLNVPPSMSSIIDNSISCFFAINESILFVATETEIYSVSFLDQTNMVTALRYTVPAGEKIVIAQQFVQGRYLLGGFDAGMSAEVPFNGKAVVVATNKGNEGTVYVIPQKNPDTGELDKNNVDIYDGFGKITALTILGV